MMGVLVVDIIECVKQRFAAGAGEQMFPEIRLAAGTWALTTSIFSEF